MSVYKKHGTAIRILYLIWSMVWFILTFGCRLKDKKMVVLCYHGIVPDQGEYFRRQILHLNNRKRGIDKSSKTKISGTFGLPDVRITFDDAFENLLDKALPLLNKYHIPAIIFAVPGNLGKSPQWNIAPDHPEYKEKIMTAEQLKSIQNEWIKIGSHTQTHPNLSKLSAENIQKELVESKRNLEQLLGKPIEDLALPHGAYNKEVLCIAQESGYKRIYTLEPKPAKDDLQTGIIGRFSMSPDVWPIEFYLTCRGAYSWLYLFRRCVRFFRGLAASGCCTLE